MRIYTKDVRRKMEDELKDIGDTFVIDYTSERYGAFDSFRATVRYVARSINLTVATDRVDSHLIVTRLNPSNTTLQFMDTYEQLGVWPRHVEFFERFSHLLQPRPNDPLFEMKTFLMRMIPSAIATLHAAVEENQKNGAYDEVKDHTHEDY